MNSLLDSVRAWAHKAVGSVCRSSRSDRSVAGIDRVSYRLSRWPLLPQKYRTARVYALLSVMTVRGVTRGWMLGKTRMAARELDLLLGWLEAAQVLQKLAAPAVPVAPVATASGAPGAAKFSAPALSMGR